MNFFLRTADGSTMLNVAHITRLFVHDNSDEDAGRVDFQVRARVAGEDVAYIMARGIPDRGTANSRMIYMTLEDS